MEGKKRYFAIILFLLIGLMVFTFANRDDEVELEDGDANFEVTEKSGSTKKEDEDATIEENEQSNLMQTDQTTNDNNAQRRNANPVQNNNGNGGNNNRGGNQRNNQNGDNQNGGNQNNGGQNNDDNQANNPPVVDTSYQDAVEKVSKAEQEKTDTAVEEAQKAIDKLPNDDKKEELQDRLDKVKDEIAEEKLLEKIEEKIKEAKENVENEKISEAEKLLKEAEELAKDLKLDENKNKVATEIAEVRKEINDLVEKLVVKAEESKDREDYDKAKSVVDELTESDAKTDFEKRLEELDKAISAEELLKELEEKVKNATDKKDIDDARKFNEDKKVKEAIESITDPKYNDLKNELIQRYEDILTILNDTTAPTIINPKDGETYNINNIKVEVVDQDIKSITIDGKEYTEDLILEDGEHTLIVIDNAYNETKITFIIDTISPVGSDVRLIGQGGTAKWFMKDDKKDKYVMYITNGNHVDIYAFYNEELKELPYLKVNGKEIGQFKNSYGKKDGLYKYGTVFNLNESDDYEDGFISVEIYGAKDKAGNIANVLTENDSKLASQKYVYIDRKAPKAIGMVMVATSGKNEWLDKNTYYMYMNNNDKLNVYAFYDKELKVLPTLKINGKELGKFKNSPGLQSDGRYKYTFTYTLKETDDFKDGLIHVEIFDYTDIIGNKGTDVLTEDNALLASQKNVYIDRTAPIIELIGDKEVKINIGEEYKDTGAKVTDSSLKEEVIVYSEDKVDTSKEGTTTLNYKFVDKAGNSSQTITRKVIVEDDDLANIKDATEKVEKAEKDPTDENINAAQDAIDKVKNDEKREELQERLDKVIENELLKEIEKKLEEVRKNIDEGNITEAEKALKEAKELVKGLKDPENIKNVEEKIKALEDELRQIKEEKSLIEKATKLLDELEKMIKEADSREDIEKAIDFNNNEKIAEVISQIKNEKIKNNLEERYEKDLKIINDNTAPIINGINNGDITNRNIAITINDDNDVTAILNGQKVEIPISIENEGTYNLVVIDKAFNKTEISFIIDKTAPVITLNGQGKFDLLAGNQYSDEGATASDNVDGDITANIKVVNNLNNNIVGNYTIEYTVVDRAGNVGQATRNINVYTNIEAPKVSYKFFKNDYAKNTGVRFKIDLKIAGDSNASYKAYVTSNDVGIEDFGITGNGYYAFKYWQGFKSVKELNVRIIATKNGAVKNYCKTLYSSVGIDKKTKAGVSVGIEKSKPRNYVDGITGTAADIWYNLDAYEC